LRRSGEVDVLLKTKYHNNMNGSVVRKQDRGFGFIKPENGEKDVFFHASELVDTDFDSLQEGDAVTFELEDGPKGPVAKSVAKA
jgi:CspA family cold shock protein